MIGLWLTDLANLVRLRLIDYPAAIFQQPNLLCVACANSEPLAEGYAFGHLCSLCVCWHKATISSGNATINARKITIGTCSFIGKSLILL